MANIQDFMRDRKDAELAQQFGRDRSYWTHVRHNRKQLSRPAALAIWRAERVKLGPLADMADADVEVLARIEGGR